METVILAGGKGSRLAPFTSEIPKPLVRVGDIPVIDILLQRLKLHGVKKVTIAVNHLSHLITAALGDGSKYGLDIVYSHEEEPLSTVGPLKLIRNLPENFLVANGDIITDLNFKELYQFHLKAKALVTVAVYQRKVLSDFGVIEVNESGYVSSFREKPVFDFTVSAGIYVFSKKVLDFIPDGKKYGFDDLMISLLEQSLPIATFPFDGYWLDIGRVEDYQQANNDIEIIRNLIKTYY